MLTQGSPWGRPSDQELEALSKAQDIISSGAVAGSAEKHLPTLLQSTSLAFLRSARPLELDQVGDWSLEGHDIATITSWLGGKYT